MPIPPAMEKATFEFRKQNEYTMLLIFNTVESPELRDRGTLNYCLAALFDEYPRIAQIHFAYTEDSLFLTLTRLA